MRDVPKIWDAWKGGVYVGDTKPSTRVTVERGWNLQTTAPVLGNWSRGPARWYQRKNATEQLETEIPSIISVNVSRSVDNDAGTCELIIQNTRTPRYGELEFTPGQFGDPGHFTWDHGAAQDARARWGQIPNPWSEVLVPNALLRTYVGFGGTDLSIPDAVTQGNLVLYGVWLVDDVVVSTDGTLTVRCRDMGKLLVDQQLFPPLVPVSLYPLSYERWKYETTPIAGLAQPAPLGDYCLNCNYWSSSTDLYYGEWNTSATGHPGTDAFDNSVDPDWRTSGEWPIHQRTYWLSEPKNGPDDTVWIEFFVNGGAAGIINEIYFHAWKGNMEGRGCMRVMASIWENGRWAPPETDLGGVGPDGIPYVCTFTPGTEMAPGEGTNRHRLPRVYWADLIRLTVTDLKWADDFPFGFEDPDFHGGGWRGGARKIMACHAPGPEEADDIKNFTYACAYMPKATGKQGYWQMRADGQVYAFGDARVHATLGANCPYNVHVAPVIDIAPHYTGNGYYTLDMTGRVLAWGEAPWEGDLNGQGFRDITAMAESETGAGAGSYWLLRSTGAIHTFGAAVPVGSSGHVGTMPYNAPATACDIEYSKQANALWVLWTDGFIDARVGAHHGNATDFTGLAFGEWKASLCPTVNGDGYWVTSSLGRVEAKGTAQHKGNADYTAPKWYRAVTWDVLPSPIGNAGYAIQTADGHLLTRGDATGLNYGSVGDGTQRQRFEGNYKDYSDIIRELLLWAGFFLYQPSVPAGASPEVYGNIESTGAYAESPLPRDMFDKRPVIEAINALREIVGYITFVDAEGGFRWESPNLWGLGNFLMDGRPLSYMPEIDETVQLISHQATRSAKDARSRLVIATQDPYPSIPGKEPPTGVVVTEIVPKTAPDLKGLIVPAMWTNGKFLLPAEQKVMADLIDMRMWFGRRTGSATCVANPLIDINDQIRVIERQTGEVYIHYIRGIDFQHDLKSGNFTMSLDTHWLGGSPWGSFTIFYAAAMRRPSGGYWTATVGGTDQDYRAGIYAYGNAMVLDNNEADSHLEPIMAMRSTLSGNGYWTMDESGKILSTGDATSYGHIYRGIKDPDNNRRCGDAADLAVTPTGLGYWQLQKDGKVTPFGDAVHLGDATPSGNLATGAEIFAISIESHPTLQGYWVLMTDGSVQAFATTYHGRTTVAELGGSHAVCLRRTNNGAGYWILGASGAVRAFGNASLQTVSYQPPPAGQPYYGLTWDILVAPDNSYALVRADGEIIAYGTFPRYSQRAPAPRRVNWALLSAEDYASLSDKSSVFPVTEDMKTFLTGTGSPSAINAVASNFAAPSSEAIEGAR